ncbi:myb-like protein X isoform X2 [Hyposmocoma kahamanoa]|uniref:myb-like protein X isoform X2 n=1 Tax=Hyposmocoma kahamanoa TaxID=1477025 RepID=UPI000E6D9EFD|nr:myb-like protein X isoform X2 [Hyposmocoma kahamanoa]
MGKKVKEYKAGDFIFAKVKGYPAWPARVQRMNGKKYFVYFYGTGETANLPPNMIFDYAENKDKFLTKTVKRRDFNDGVKQIEHDFANNVPLEQVIGGDPEAVPAEGADESANDTGINESMDDNMDTTNADDTVTDTTASNATQNDTAVEDSDEAGALVIDEGKQPPKGRKSKAEPKKEPPKTPKTPRGKAKKDEDKRDEDEEKKDEEIVSRSGRKIRPKRYIDEQTEENTTLPSPAPKKRRGASPDKEKEKDKQDKEKPAEKTKQFNNVSPAELEDLKEPFKPADTEKENILIAYLPTNQYIGIKLFQSRPPNFKNEAVRLQWDKQAAANALTLKMQLEKGQITPQSILAQLVLDLNLTDEEKATLDKERETEKRSRVQFLKTEMKLIELDAKIKTCLCLEKADTDLCLKLLDNLMELEIQPLMLLKHPSCLETIKRMRAYVGNTPSWDLSETDSIHFSKQAHRIRKQADHVYKYMKDLFTTPEGLSFWEFFSERVLQFKKATSTLNADELLEMVHEPIEMTQPTSHTLKAAIDIANEEEPLLEEEKEDTLNKKKATPAKNKKAANSTPAKPPLKRQSSRKQVEEKQDKEKQTEKQVEKQDKQPEKQVKQTEKQDQQKEKQDTPTEKETDKEQTEKEPENTEQTQENINENSQADENNKVDENSTANEDPKQNDVETEQEKEVTEKETEAEKDKPEEQTKEKENSKDKDSKEKGNSKDKDPKDKGNSKEKDTKGKQDSKEKDSKQKADSKEKDLKDIEKESNGDENDKSDKDDKDKHEEKEKDEPRAKRSRGESKKTDVPPRSPAKRKAKN